MAHNEANINRREFIRNTGRGALVAGAAAGLAISAAEQPAGAPNPVRLGGPIFEKSDDPELLARAHRNLQYGAAYCPAVALEDTDRVRAISEAFARHDVVIAEVGRWCNLLDADPAKRKTNMEAVINGLALAEEIGARCCVNIAGSFNPDIWYGPHPKNLSREFFDAAVENARKIVDAVKPRRAKFTYEMMGWSLPDSADSCLEMIHAIDREGFGAHLDPCNLINSPERFYRNADVIRECFDKLGPHIVSCHAKDLHWEVDMNVHFREVGPGNGAMDYPVYLKGLAALPQQPPLMLEHLPDAEAYDAARKHLLELGSREGITFG